MKRYLILLCICCLMLPIAAENLSIFYTNDTHAAYLPRTFRSSEGNMQLGGFAALEYHLKTLRAEKANSIYLDAGDQQTGSILSTMPYNGLQGAAILEIFKMLDLDAATLGNHEFDVSYEHAKALVNTASYPFISTNIMDADGSSFGKKPYHILQRGNLKIGLMGLTLVELPEKVKIENVSKLKILPYKEAIDKYLDEVDKASDLIILITHNGWEADSLLATQLDDRVDMIIGGHSHIGIDKALAVNGIYILSAGSHLQVLGVADIEVKQDRIVSFKNRLHPLTPPPKAYSSVLTKFLEDSVGELEKALSKVAGTLPFAFEVDKFRVTQGSKWIADALLKEYAIYGAELALINNGGLRKHLPAGDVSLKDLHEYIPFGNTVTFFSCYGRDLLKAEQKNRKLAIDKPYDILSSSASGWLDPKAMVNGIVIGSQALDPDKIYRVVSHDYVAGQWDKYLGFKPFDVIDRGDLFLDAIISRIIQDFGSKDQKKE